MNSLYLDSATTDAPEGVSACRPIEDAKSRIPILEGAERSCEGGVQKRGSGYVARCPVPDHSDENPSCKISPDEGRWWCFVCSEGGDVVDMYAVANGYENPGEAAGYLLLEFGYEIPPRPDSWHRRQKRQRPVRDALEDARVRRCQRRLYRWLFQPIVAAFEDEAERREEKRIAWDECGKIARMIAAQGRGEAR